VTDAPRIEFPCDYPIRVIGEQEPGFRDRVLAIVRDQVDAVEESSVTVQESRAGSYCSVRVTIVATGEAQLKRLHAALMAEPAVRMVL
jgi:putative lipoic acid-binding regulatory protein